MSSIKKIHHVAIAVTDLQQALVFWQDILGIENSELRDIPQEEAQVAFLPLGESEIELVFPTSNDSGLAKYISKRGAGIHHLCLEVDNLEAMLSRLKQNNIRLINEEPRVDQNGRRYAFIHPESAFGVLVELYEKIP